MVKKMAGKIGRSIERDDARIEKLVGRMVYGKPRNSNAVGKSNKLRRRNTGKSETPAEASLEGLPQDATES